MAIRQITKLEHRERILAKMKWAELHHQSALLTSAEPPSGAKEQNGRPSLGFRDADPLPYTPPQYHHHISDSISKWFEITSWLGEHSGDPALRVIIFSFFSITQ
jgi:hypothetical protein